MRINPLVSIWVVFLLVGCASTTRTMVNPNYQARQYDNAYVIVHGGSSHDMDSALTSALMRENLGVEVGKDAPDSASQQYVVTYSDDWNWDMAMFLVGVSISIKDGISQAIIARGSWKQTQFFHTFPDVDEVVGQLVRKIFVKIDSMDDAVDDLAENDG